MNNKKYKKWTNEEINKLENMINNYMTYDEIANKLERTKSAIQSKCYKNNLKMKRVNDNFFDCLNNEKGWFLGLFVADGYVFKNTGFGICNTDLSIVKKIKKMFKSKNKIFACTNREQSYGDKTVYKFKITSYKLSNFLKSINCYGVKDKRNPFEFIPPSLKYSFIKGYFDGDGCVYSRRNSIIISGRKEIITDMYNWITADLNIKRNKIYSHSLSDKTFEFRIHGENSIKFAKAIKNNTKNTFKTEKTIKLYDIIQ